MYNEILIATDGNRASISAVETGVEIAVRHKANVHALYVVKTDSSLGHFDPVVERRESTGERAVEFVEDYATLHDVNVTKAFRYGRPDEQIISYAGDHNLDLIVVGSSKRSGLSRILYPKSISERIIRDADVPVLVVGEHSDQGPSRAFECLSEQAKS